MLDPFGANFYEWCKIGVQSHSFASEYPVSPAPLVEETALSSLRILGSLVKRQSTLLVWVRVSALLFLIGLCAVSMPAPCCLEDYSFVITVGNQEM